jgi:23S rRNA (cytosine1962-C5)-methyltransferase
LAERLEPRGIIRKLVYSAEAAGEERGPEGVPLERGKVGETVVHGERPPQEMAVLERWTPFRVRLLGARHTGLFTDMREERQRLQSLAAGLRVLNTFSYTGGFSVAAALGGAHEVVSVDVVAKVHDWARENFRLSGLDPGAHRFVRMDTMEYLDLAARKGWTFGAIVLDPPTFARAKAASWSLGRHYPALIRRALEVLEPGGYLWVSANSASAREAEVDRWIQVASSAARRPLALIARGGQPLDYPAPPGFPRYRYLKIRVLRAGGGA